MNRAVSSGIDRALAFSQTVHFQVVSIVGVACVLMGMSIGILFMQEIPANFFKLYGLLVWTLVVLVACAFFRAARCEQ